MVLTRFIYRLALAFILITRAAGMVLSQKSPSTTKGTVQRIKVHGKSLEENLEGETADPDIFDFTFRRGTRRIGMADILRSICSTATGSPITTNKQLEEVLINLGIEYKVETCESDHTNRIAERIEKHVLPFFSLNLAFRK